MEKKTETEKNRGRIEKRIAFIVSEIGWMQEKEGWEGLKCIGPCTRNLRAKEQRAMNDTIIFPAGN